MAIEATDEMSGAPGGAAPQEVEPNEYAHLKRLVKEAGLLEKNPGYYAVKLTVNMSLLALSVAVLTLVDGVWPQILNAAPSSIHHRADELYWTRFGPQTGVSDRAEITIFSACS